VRWAEVFHAATLVYARKYAQAESAFEDLLSRVDSVRHPAMAGRIQWMRTSGSLRDKAYARARPLSRSAARLFERAHETEFMGYAHALDGEAAYYQRDTAAAYPAMHRGLMSLRRYRSSTWLHNTLLVLANSAAADGMPMAAAKFQDEDAPVARRSRVSVTAVEALLGSAGMRLVTGRSQEAMQDLDRAGAMLAAVGRSESQEKLSARARYMRALMGTDSASLAGLDSAVAHFAGTKDLVSLLPALLRRADVRLAQKELPAATADLDSATALIRGISQEPRDAYLRIAMMDRARRHFDQLVMLQVHAGNWVAALQALERGRVSFAPRSSSTAPAPRRLAAPPGTVAVEYALIGDTLLTWTIRGADVRLRQDTLERDGFLRMIDQVNAALESPARAPLAQRSLERLYELLVRPVKARLGASGTQLVILADGELAGVPFAALRDAAARGRYLIEDHALRFPANLADAARPTPARDGAARPALLVANPAFDPLHHPGLDPLEDAQLEVDSLAGFYPGSTKLSGAAATRSAFTAAAPRAGLIHYAGHAVFDDARPERSALVLAGADTTGSLTAEAVNGLQLRGVRLVVLASCRTLRAREGRSGGFSGFSGALLSAGAGGVVGSLWQVDDELTRPFMLAFHRAYQQNGDPAAALRAAQVEMLRLNDPRLRSPAVWGGFRYIGH
jgi:CHAT domain-containing protein